MRTVLPHEARHRNRKSKAGLALVVLRPTRCSIHHTVDFWFRHGVHWQLKPCTPLRLCRGSSASTDGLVTPAAHDSPGEPSRQETGPELGTEQRSAGMGLEARVVAASDVRKAIRMPTPTPDRCVSDDLSCGTVLHVRCIML